MPIPAGTMLGPYEVLAPIGAGGMGEVYKATDTRLHREVAIKVSADRFSERFEREARAIAALNHPNICTLYDVGPNYLVMEFVDGDRLKGPLPLGEALEIAGQIADALQAAHERGITHRDLKPANILIKHDGTVKVLDFGLAKLAPEAAASPLREDSPTMSLENTKAGLILGTAAYMSPEQTRGKSVGPRTDIWAFGVVLYEMLTGRRPFRGEDLAELVAAILREQPDFSSVPHQFRRLLEACLQKDPRKRLQAIGDWKLALNDRKEPTSKPRPTSWGAWLLAGLATLAAATAGAMHFREKPPPIPASISFQIAQPSNIAFTDVAVVSPDGRKLAFIASTPGGVRQLWVRSLNAVEMHPLSETEDVRGFPFWSMDSRYLVFTAQGKLQKIEASGGPAMTLCTAPDNNLLGGFWTRDNKIIFGGQLAPNGLQQVDAAGGAPSPLTTMRPGDIAHGFPVLLPDGRHFLFSVRTESGGGIYLGSLDAKPNAQLSKKLLPDMSPVAYVPASYPKASTRGYVLFVRGVGRDARAGGTLMAQPFDEGRLDVGGDAVPIAERVRFYFSAPADGTLVFRAMAASPVAQLTWFDRKGGSAGPVGEPSAFEVNSPVALSPDGKRLAFARTDAGNTDIWIHEFARNVASRLTVDRGEDVNPVWSPDGKAIAFAGQRGGAWGIYQRASNFMGGEELLYKSPDVVPRPSSWSGDRRFLLFTGEFAWWSIWVLPMDRPLSGILEARPKTLPRSAFNEESARFSPDGRYFAYVSSSSGRNEVYVRPFDSSSAGIQSGGGASMISKNAARSVRWRGDGKEILYTTQGGDLVSVEVSTTPVFQAGAPKPLFRAPESSNWDVTADGQRFLFAVPVGENSASPYTVVTNWQEALKH